MGDRENQDILENLENKRNQENCQNKKQIGILKYLGKLGKRFL